MPYLAMNKQRGYTLVELIVAVGLFAVVMLLASGAYLFMIGLNRQVQGVASGIDNLSFALEAMTRDIRTGTVYRCNGTTDCSLGASSFTFTNENGVDVTYNLSTVGTTVLQKAVGVGAPVPLTDPSSVTITSLIFYAVGMGKPTDVPPDLEQPRVTIVISGTVSAGAGKPSQQFVVETGATMRGSDI